MPAFIGGRSMAGACACRGSQVGSGFVGDDRTTQAFNADGADFGDLCGDQSSWVCSPSPVVDAFGVTTVTGTLPAIDPPPYVPDHDSDATDLADLLGLRRPLDPSLPTDFSVFFKDMSRDESTADDDGYPLAAPDPQDQSSASANYNPIPSNPDSQLVFGSSWTSTPRKRKHGELDYPSQASTPSSGQ